MQPQLFVHKGRVTLFNTATKSYWIATTEKLITSKEMGRE